MTSWVSHDCGPIPKGKLTRLMAQASDQSRIRPEPSIPTPRNSMSARNIHGIRTDNRTQNATPIPIWRNRTLNQGFACLPNSKSTIVPPTNMLTNDPRAVERIISHHQIPAVTATPKRHNRLSRQGSSQNCQRQQWQKPGSQMTPVPDINEPQGRNLSIRDTSSLIANRYSAGVLNA